MIRIAVIALAVAGAWFLCHAYKVTEFWTLAACVGVCAGGLLFSGGHK